MFIVILYHKGYNIFLKNLQKVLDKWGKMWYNRAYLDKKGEQFVMYLDWVEMSYHKFPTFNNSFERDRYESCPYIDEEEYDDEELDEDELQD